MNAATVVSIAGHDRKHYVDDIAVAWPNKQAEGFLAVGNILKAAKKELPLAAFDTMAKTELPFGAQTGYRLRRIAEHPILGNPENAKRLPPAWSLAYRLSMLPDDVLLAGLQNNAIYPAMTIRDVISLQRKRFSKSKPAIVSTTVEPTVVTKQPMSAQTQLSCIAENNIAASKGQRMCLVEHFIKQLNLNIEDWR